MTASNVQCHYEDVPLNHPTPKPDSVSDAQVLSWAETILAQRFQRSNYLTHPGDARDYLKVILAHHSTELFGMIFLDNQHGILGFNVLFQGTIDGAAVYPREVVKAALKRNAAAVVLAHNHPSGIAHPSMADRNITQRIISALETVDIRVLDHLIIAGTQTVSFAELGLLSP